MKTLFFTAYFMLFAFIAAKPSDIPRTITQQGILTSSDGTAIEDGMYSLTLHIYDVETSGNPLWTETQTVSIINGLFTVQLGNNEPLDLDFDTQYWLGISVEGGDELEPRIPFSPVPYSFHAYSVPDGSISTAKLAESAVKSSHLAPDLNINTTGFIEASSFIGDGSQLTNLTVEGFNLPFEGEASFDEEYALSITNTGYGIRGWSTAPTGRRYGVFGLTESSVGRGVHGEGHFGVSGLSWSPGGLGVIGQALDAGQLISFGVRGDSHSTTGIGVYGWALASSGNTQGVWGTSNSTSGIGVFGSARASSGVTYGVFGRAYSPDGRGVYGKGRSGWGYLGGEYGVYGEHNNGNYGRLGTVGSGVVGRSNTSNGIGIMGIQGADALRAGHFGGNVHITGTLSKGGGSFEIDHPLNPENMVLRHSFVESPDMMNVYNGNVVTDAAGEAVVHLPDYFEVLNKDFRYQLTVIGEFAQAIIAEEIVHNRFVIRSDKPNVKVSWQVTGIRKDRWAEENRIVVEEYKSPETRGFYIHPDLFGQPETRSMEWGLQPEYMKQMSEEREHIEKVRLQIDEKQIRLDEAKERFLLEETPERSEPERR